MSYDPLISNLFMATFSMGAFKRLPNMEAKYIQQLVNSGDYKMAVEKLLEYIKEHTDDMLEIKVADLESNNKGLQSEIHDLHVSNNAEHAEKVKYWNYATDLLHLVDRFIQIVGSYPDNTEFALGTLHEARSFIAKNKGDIDP